jgi:glycosyltransferase involved in cell wall biosynthesis
VFERSLSIICPQIKRFRDDVEFIISDNCSPDNTTEVVKYYIDEGMPVRYIKNDYNLGSSLNIINCYKMAKGKYVWVLGDDDYLTEDAIGFIINILRNDKDYGLLFYSICCEGSGFTEYKDKKGIFCKYKLYNSLD